MRFLRALTVLCFATLPALAGASSLDTIIIDRGVDEPIRIAIAPFRSEVTAEQEMSDIVSFDLARSGQFDPLASENMLSHPASRKEVFFRDWRILKAAYLVIGTVRQLQAGQLEASFELYDVIGERQMITRRYTFVASQWRDVAHRIADAVYE